MVCPEMAVYTERAGDAVEQELGSCAPADGLIGAAELWWEVEEARGRGHHRAAVSSAAASRWPILCAWRWFLPMEEREAAYGQDAGGRSADDVRQEGANDLAYRCVMPRGLGSALCSLAGGTSGESDGDHEESATLLQRDALEGEVARRRRAMHEVRQAIQITTALALGLRSIRIEFASRVAAWKSLWEAENSQLGADESGPPSLGELGSQVDPLGVIERNLRHRVQEWANSAAGQLVVAQLRWSVPSHSVLVDRIRGELRRFGGANQQQIRRACASLGIPVREHGQVSWGVELVSWFDARAALNRRCMCYRLVRPAALGICSACGGAELPDEAAESDSEPSRCRWCGAQCATICPGCNRCVHFLGECRRWLHGASRLYALQALEDRWLCPDCPGEWVRILPVTPLRPPSDNAEVHAHMCSLGSRCVPGAGASHSAGDVSGGSVGVRRCRRWILRHLARTQWVRVTRVVESGCAAMRVRSGLSGLTGDVVSLRTSLHSTIDLLIREGKLWSDGSGRCQAVRSRRGGENGLPHRAIHSRRPGARRRRPRDAPAAGEAPSGTRRRLE
jgi:hypothetical protein